MLKEMVKTLTEEQKTELRGLLGREPIEITNQDLLAYFKYEIEKGATILEGMDDSELLDLIISLRSNPDYPKYVEGYGDEYSACFQMYCDIKSGR